MATGVYPRTDEYRRKMSDACRGKRKTAEHRRRIAQGLRSYVAKHGHWSTSAHMAKMRALRPATPTKHTLESRFKIGSAQRGPLHWNWQGGKTERFRALRNAIRALPEYAAWRNAVFTRDNFACVKCRARSEASATVELNADHIKPFTSILFEHAIDSLEKALACSELWDITNGRTLCLPCHKSTPTYAGHKRPPSP